MPVYQVTEQTAALRTRTLLIVAESEYQAVDLYNEGSYTEESIVIENEDSDVELTIIELTAN